MPWALPTRCSIASCGPCAPPSGGPAKPSAEAQRVEVADGRRARRHRSGPLGAPGPVRLRGNGRRRAKVLLTPCRLAVYGSAAAGSRSLARGKMTDELVDGEGFEAAGQPAPP